MTSGNKRHSVEEAFSWQRVRGIRGAVAVAMPKQKQRRSRVVFAPLPTADDPTRATPWVVNLVDYLQGRGEAVGASALWALSSIAMTLLNKQCVTKTRAPVAVVIVQMLATALLALVVGLATKNLRFGAGASTWAAVVPPLFVLMMASSMVALKYVSVGAFVVVRNLGPLVTLGVEVAFHQPDGLRCDAATVGACLALAFGVLLYESHDLAFSPTGLVFLLLNLGAACMERLAQRHLLAVKAVDCSRPALMILNNGVGAALGVVLLLVFAPHEWRELRHAVRRTRGAALAVGLSSVVGCAISYAGLWLQKLVTATSFMVLGCITKVAVIAWGVLFLADAHSPLALFGAALSVGGGYAYARSRTR